MFPIYDYFEKGEQAIIPTAEIIKASKKVKLTVEKISIFLYNFNVFILLFILTLILAKVEQSYTINYSTIAINYQKEEKLNLIIFIFFECHLIISGIVYRQFVFLKEHSFILTQNFSIKEFIFTVLCSLYFNVYEFIDRFENRSEFFVNFFFSFLLYSLFAEKNSKRMYISNILVGFVSSLLLIYCNLIVTKVRIAILCYNYLIIIPEILVYIQKSFKNGYILQIIIIIYNYSILAFLCFYYNTLKLFDFWGFKIIEFVPIVILVNLIAVFIYPFAFNYFYWKYKMKILGKWDLPEINNFY